MNVGAFNLGNTIGAAAGGRVIATGPGYPTVALASEASSALGLVAITASVRRTSTTGEPQSGEEPGTAAL